MLNRSIQFNFVFDSFDSVVWDTNVKRYRWNSGDSKGKFIGEVQLKKLTELTIQDTENRLTQTTKNLIQGKLSLLDYQFEIKNQLKELHLANMLLARGGKRNVSNVDYLTVGRQLREEYKYFRGLVIDIRNGYSVNDNGKKIPLTEAKLLNRIRLYAEAGKISYDQGIRQNKIDMGYKYAQRFLNSQIPCSTCPGYAELGVQPISILPLPKTQCECGRNCKCSIVYYQEKPTDNTF